MWYYASAGSYEGPFQEAYIGRKLRAGVISQSTLVWCDGMEEWLPLVETELASLLHHDALWQNGGVPQPGPASRQQPQQSKPSQQAPKTPRVSIQDYEQSGFEKPQQGRPSAEEEFDNDYEYREEEYRADEHEHEEHGEYEDEYGARGAGARAKAKAKAQARARTKAAGNNQCKNGWQDLSSATAAVSWLFTASALVTVSMLLLHLAEFQLGLPSSEFSWQTSAIIRKAGSLCSFLGSVAFLVWVVRAISNLDVLKARSLDLTGGWVVVSFFIPFVNFLVPYLAMRKLWRASFAPRAWTNEPVAPLVTFMWLAWLFSSRTWDSGFLISAPMAMPFGPEFEVQFRLFLPILLKVVSDVTVVLFVRAIWRAQSAARSAA